MHDYINNVKELVRNAKVSPSDIFDYQFSPIQAIYDLYYQYCQENLLNHNKEYDIQPAKFYYRTSFDVNARAGLVNGYYVIGVNMGAIQTLYSMFYDNNTVFEDDVDILELFKSISPKEDEPFSYLLYQLATIFTYHHELAHLIQKSPILSLGFSEQYDDTGANFSIERHVLELDADLNGSHLICFHLRAYFDNLKLEEQTLENIQKLFSLGVASVFCYFLLYYKDSKTIYYKDKTHPHPLVRISYLVDSFVRIAEKNLPENFSIDTSEIIRLGFIISDKFFQTTGDKTIVDDFGKQFYSESKNIEAYINELLEIGQSMLYLVKNRK